MCKKKSAGGMGFRSVRDFNISLLGKQGWRLLKYPEKLVSKVYKARYYPQGSFLNAKIGPNPSYIWRSVLESQTIIRSGIGCRVGNGQSINIMEDPWLPLETGAYVQTFSEAFQGQTVSSLMSMDSNSWDIDLVLDMFDSREAHIILSIPLNKDVEDSWYWRCEKLGNYSVKSAYHLMQEEKEDHSASANSGFWRKLWNLKIPPKIKNFLWRASTKSLPTKDMLRVRRFQVNAFCPVCNVELETVLHTLVLCPHAVSSWEKISNVQIFGDFNSFSEWLQLVFQQKSNEEVCIIVTISWMLWKNRNDLIWNQRSIELSEVVQSALSILNQWKSVQDRTFDRFLGYMSSDDGDEHWSLPLPNSVKVNADAAIFEDSNCYSYAFVSRDCEGNLIEARSSCLRGRPNADLAEAMSIREALSWVKNSDYSEVMVESDCLQVVQAIRSSFMCYSYLGRVIKQCRDIMASLSNKNVKFRFVKRSANKVAHYLAKQNCSVVDRIWRMGDVHSDLYDVLSNDLKK